MVDKRGPDECWGWRAQKRWDGYGRFFDKRPLWGHRFSYELHHGAIPAGMEVMHKCDRPECTNPKHLRLGTHQQNMDDQKAKRRHSYGERNYNAVLTEAQVREIITKYTGKRGEIARFAREYGVGDGAIGALLSGKSWKHLRREST
jgi:hypothetical protein